MLKWLEMRLGIRFLKLMLIYWIFLFMVLVRVFINLILKLVCLLFLMNFIGGKVVLVLIWIMLLVVWVVGVVVISRNRLVEMVYSRWESFIMSFLVEMMIWIGCWGIGVMDYLFLGLDGVFLCLVSIVFLDGVVWLV